MQPRFRVDFSVYLILAIGLLTLPVAWLMGAILAAGFHELCHYLVARRLGISCCELHIGVGGITMFLPCTTEKEELIIAAAGPLGSFLLLAFIRSYPQLAVCAFVQGLFNLLPIYPLDGGRILRCVLMNREGLCKGIENCTIVLLLGAAITAGIWFRLGLFPLFVSVLASGKAIQRKFPCKAVKLGVQ